MIKLLITSGCSFSQVPNADITWPVHLTKYLNVSAVHRGKGAVGNGVISRTIIHSVTEALKTYKPEELLVGVMWSGLNRFEIYREDKDIEFSRFDHISDREEYCNPQFIINKRNYLIVNPMWEDKLSKLFYKNIYSEEWGCIVNIEHILRTQWFLKSSGIKYFMTAYDSDAFPEYFNVENNEEIKLLSGLIEYDKWIDIKNMGIWAKNTGLPYARPPDHHPSTEMHEKYVIEHIIPHLKTKHYI